MSRLTSTPLLIVVLIASLAGAAGLTARALTSLPAAASGVAHVAATATPIPLTVSPSPTTVAGHRPALPGAGPPPVPPRATFSGARLSSHPPGASPRPLVYTALGASDTVGVGADDPPTQSWAADLARRLPAGSTFHNLGVSGILVAAALRKELPGAVASRPSLVTVWFAVNDLNARVALSRYTHDLSVMLKTLHLHTHAAIFVGNVPALSLLPSYAAVAGPALNALVARWNAAIATVVARYGAVLVDLYNPSLTTLPAHPEYISADGFHPSTQGYQDQERTFWRVILKHRGHLPLR